MNMEIKLKDKWKYIAKDYNDVVYMYDNKPKIKNDREWSIRVGNSCSVNNILDISYILQCQWKNSLHHILPDGTLKKIIVNPDIPVDTPVWVKKGYYNRGQWEKRHFSRWNDEGKMICWNDGYTSHTVNKYISNPIDTITTWDQYSLTDPKQNVIEDDDLF